MGPINENLLMGKDEELGIPPHEDMNMVRPGNSVDGQLRLDMGKRLWGD